MNRLLVLPFMLAIACTSEGASSSDTDTDADTASTSDGPSGTEASDTDTGTGDTGTGPTCEGGGLEPGDHVIELDHDDRLRVFQVHVPPSYTGTELTPLVVNLHGLGSNGTQQQFFSYMDPLADAEGFLVVYPEGTVNSEGKRAWNAGVCCTDDPSVDDVAFIRAMLDELDAIACIDPARRFATGMSNGGLMSYRLGCEAADLFAAIAPVAGALGLDASSCTPERPVPLWQIHGTIDNRVPFDGARSSAELWADLNACGAETFVTYQNGVVTCEAWDCPEGSEVEFCTAEGVDHCWPGQPFCIDPPSTEDIDSTAAIWAFFEAHPMPG